MAAASLRGRTAKLMVLALSTASATRPYRRRKLEFEKESFWEQLPTSGETPSMCLKLTDYSMMDRFPTRSPLLVADHLISLVKGRSFGEIGTRNGDIMGCVSKYASSVTAVEMDQSHCKVLSRRGFKVVCRDFMSLKPHEFPIVDVLYWWPQMSWDQNQMWMEHTARAYEALNRTVRRPNEDLLQSFDATLGPVLTVTVVVGFDSHWAADMVSLPKMMRRFGGHAVKRILFDEGGTWENMFRIMHKEFRPGHWGVFHLAHFKVGAAGTFRMAEILARSRASFAGCGSFRNPFSPADEPPCPLALH